MSEETPDLKTLALRLKMIADRLEKLEVQVRGLVTSQTVEAKEFVVPDDRGEIRARLEMEQYAPCPTWGAVENLVLLSGAQHFLRKLVRWRYRRILPTHRPSVLHDQSHRPKHRVTTAYFSYSASLKASGKGFSAYSVDGTWFLYEGETMTVNLKDAGGATVYSQGGFRFSVNCGDDLQLLNTHQFPPGLYDLVSGATRQFQGSTVARC